MKVIALYKTFSGEEFIEASLESIYPFVDKIVMVHSHISWGGEVGNTVIPVVRRWKRNDFMNKICELVGDYIDQNDQYNAGLDFIKQNFEYDYIMLIDTDEIWDEKNLRLAFRTLRRKTSHIKVYTCNLHTYIKSPFYRIDPPDPCRPSVFITPAIEKFESARAWDVVPRYLLGNVHCHHFSLVRNDLASIKKKIFTSAIGDVSGTDEKQEIVVNWFENKWDKLPDVSDFHYQKKFWNWWKGIKIVGMDDLPLSLLSKPILKQFVQEVPCG